MTTASLTAPWAFSGSSIPALVFSTATFSTRTRSKHFIRAFHQQCNLDWMQGDARCNALDARKVKIRRWKEIHCLIILKDWTMNSQYLGKEGNCSFSKPLDWPYQSKGSELLQSIASDSSTQKIAIPYSRFCLLLLIIIFRILCGFNFCILVKNWMLFK